jgi:phosphoglycolate phosphatase
MTLAPTHPHLGGATRIDAILFDLDGTLLHTAPDLAAAANRMLQALKLPTLSDAHITTFVGKGVPNLVARCVAAASPPHAAAPSEQTLQNIVHIYHGYYTELNGQCAQKYDGVIEGLDAFKARGYKLGVCTNKPIGFTLPLLKMTGLADYFQVTVGGDTCARKKPDAMPMLHACDQLGAKAAHTLMIGDSTNDCQAARAAGMPVWVLPYGYNEGRPVQELDCDGIVPTLRDAAQQLQRLLTN